MKIDLLSITCFYAVETDNGQEITVIRNYDQNIDRDTFELVDINSNETINENSETYKEVVNHIKSL